MSSHYNVAPRYSGGSPAAVPKHVAEHVARQEQDHYKHCLKGVYGDEAKEKAERLGLSGIVEFRVEYATGWSVMDLCTDRIFFRPFELTFHAVRRGNANKTKRGSFTIRDRVCLYCPKGYLVRGRILDIQRTNEQNRKKTAYPSDAVLIEGHKRVIGSVDTEIGIHRVEICEIGEVQVEF